MSDASTVCDNPGTGLIQETNVGLNWRHALARNEVGQCDQDRPSWRCMRASTIRTTTGMVPCARRRQRALVLSGRSELAKYTVVAT